MSQNFNLNLIKERYAKYLQEAQDRGKKILPYYEIELWDEVLNKVEKRVFADLKYIGLRLYPIYPISEIQYLHFANPFKKIGIEIVYKNSSKNIIHRKTELLKSSGWTIYEINSTDTYHTIEEFFRIKRKIKTVEYDDLTDNQFFAFWEKYKSENCCCLLHYIKSIHFDNYTYA